MFTNLFNADTQTWQQHPDTLVGFFPRSHAYQISSPREQGEEDAGLLWEYLYFWRCGLSEVVEFGSKIVVFLTVFKVQLPPEVCLDVLRHFRSIWGKIWRLNLCMIWV